MITVKFLHVFAIAWVRANKLVDERPPLWTPGDSPEHLQRVRDEMVLHMIDQLVVGVK